MTSPFDKVWRATLACLSPPTGRDGVPRRRLVRGLVDALDSHEQCVHRLEEQHFYVEHTSFGGGGVRKKCAEGGVSSVASFSFS